MPESLILVDPDGMLGKLVIAGTWIAVDPILEKMAAGKTIEQILEEHPQLTREGILAALAYVSDTMKSVRKHPAGGATRASSLYSGER